MSKTGLLSIFENVASMLKPSVGMQFCKSVLKNTNEGFFYATNSLPTSVTRQAGFAIRAFGIELDNTYKKDDSEAVDKFSCWRENISSIYDHNKVCHPNHIADELLLLVNAKRPPEDLLMNMIIAKEIQHKNKGINTMVEFKTYAEYVHAAPYYWILHFMDNARNGNALADHKRLRSLAYNVGQSEAVMDVCKSLKKKSSWGMVDLPKTLLFDHDLTRHCIRYNNDHIAITNAVIDLVSYGRQILSEVRTDIETNKLPVPLRSVYGTVPIITMFFNNFAKEMHNAYSQNVDNQISWYTALKSMRRADNQETEWRKRFITDASAKRNSQTN